MRKFIKVYVTEKMEKEYEDCYKLGHEGIDKDCNTCSCYGGANIGCIIDSDEYKEVDYWDIREIARHHGYEKQSRQCMEECGELIQAINKFWRKYPRYGDMTMTQPDYLDMLYSKERENVVEEIADVRNATNELIELLRCEDKVVEIADQKVQRELERIQGEVELQEELERIQCEEDLGRVGMEKQKSATEIIEEVRGEMCDEYCKHIDKALRDNNISELCNKCPLNKL